jgi:hypothetical protein
LSDTNSGGGSPGPFRLKLGGGIDPDAVARAEAALKSLSVNFAAWLEEELVKIEAAMRATAEAGPASEAGETLYMRAHDLKGLGTTYEFPLISRIAASLCKLIEKAELRAKAPLALLEAHVAAIRTAAREAIKTDEDPRGAAMVKDLEARAGEHLAR